MIADATAVSVKLCKVCKVMQVIASWCTAILSMVLSARLASLADDAQKCPLPRYLFQ